MSPQEIWQADERNAPTLTLAQALRRLGEFQARNRGMVRRFFIAQLLITAFFGWSIFVRHSGQILVQSALAFMNLMVWWGGWRLKQRLTPARFDAGASVLDTARYYRSELVRDLDLFERRRLERLIAMVAALVLLAIAYWIELHKTGFVVFQGALLAFLLFASAVTARVKRRQMQGEIEAVDLLTSNS